MKVKSLSHVQLFATPWTAASQTLLSMGFSRQENWSGLPLPSPRDLPNSGIEPGSHTLQADALLSKPPVKPIIKSNFNFSFIFRMFFPLQQLRCIFPFLQVLFPWYDISNFKNVTC